MQRAEKKHEGRKNEEQKKALSLSDEELEEEVPEHPWETAKRLWEVAGDQRWRLVVASISAIFYVVGTLWAAFTTGMVRPPAEKMTIASRSVKAAASR